MVFSSGVYNLKRWLKIWRGEASLLDSESKDAIAAFEVHHHVSSGRNNEVLLPVYGIRGRRCIHPSSSLELPQNLAGRRVIGFEPAVAFAGKDKAASCGEDAANHGL